MRRPPLPIDDVLPALCAALASGRRAVLQAPPGAGKTTAAPLALVHEPWAQGGRIVMLEPRRLAARAAARRMAALSGSAVGDLVGFRVRGESHVGPRTRIEVVTEGVLTRMLVRDPTLDGVAAVIFDEFHERSVVADVGLALTLRTAELLRSDLRLVVMSATIDGAAVAALLGGAPVITATGRAFDVAVQWVPPRPGARPLDDVAGVVRRALGETDGDVLVFLPGAAEIRRVAQALESLLPHDGPRVFALHGSMPAAEQDAAIAASPAGTRKVVLATSIAETSLTIEGVRAVVDSGVARVPRFDPGSGMARLATVRVTRNAAEQRRGRAGRVAPGTCYRLWSEGEHAALLAQRTPEILSADLAPLALDLALAGAADTTELRWLDAPPTAAMAQARELLTELDALDVRGEPTTHGRRMADLGLHPRIAHLVLRGVEAGRTRLACEIAALLGERDIFSRRGPGSPEADPDLAARILAIRGEGDLHDATADRGQLMRVREEARRIAGRLRTGSTAEPATHATAKGSGAGTANTASAPSDDLAACGELLALAYPDRVALARTESQGGRGGFRMRNGRGARVAAGSALTRADALAIADTDGARDDARVYLAAALDRDAIERLFGAQVRETDDVALDESSGALIRTTSRMLGALVLEQRVERVQDSLIVAEAFIARVRRDGVSTIPWNDSAMRVRERLAFMHHHDTQWPAMNDDALVATLETWFFPALEGVRRWDDVARADLGTGLLSLVPPTLRKSLDSLAPSHITVATGSRVPVSYADPAAPTVAVRIQELFGTGDTPRVGGGRVALTLHLLSPAGRPLQVTRDLGGFWAGSYAEVRKEMRGRYPRHPWPENPRDAPATKRATPRKSPDRR